MSKFQNIKSQLTYMDMDTAGGGFIDKKQNTTCGV